MFYLYLKYWTFIFQTVLCQDSFVFERCYDLSAVFFCLPVSCNKNKYTSYKQTIPTYSIEQSLP